MDIERGNNLDSKRNISGSRFSKQSSNANLRGSQSVMSEWHIGNLGNEAKFKAEIRVPSNLKAFLHQLIAMKAPVQLWVVFATHQLVLCFSQLPKTFFIRLRINYKIISPPGLDKIPAMEPEGADPMGIKLMSACFDISDFKKLIDISGEDQFYTLTFERYNQDAIEVTSLMEVNSSYGKEEYKASSRGFCTVDGALLQGVPIDNFDNIITGANDSKNQLLTIEFQNEKQITLIFDFVGAFAGRLMCFILKKKQSKEGRVIVVPSDSIEEVRSHTYKTKVTLIQQSNFDIRNDHITKDEEVLAYSSRNVQLISRLLLKKGVTTTFSFTTDLKLFIKASVTNLAMEILICNVKEDTDFVEPKLAVSQIGLQEDEDDNSDESKSNFDMRNGSEMDSRQSGPRGMRR